MSLPIHLGAPVLIGLRWLGMALFYAGLAGAVIWLRRARVRVLLYHTCEERETEFTRGLRGNVTPREFGEQLDFVRKHYQVVPTDTIAGGLPLPPRAICITFDDGYRSVLTGAAAQMESLGVPYTVFLISGVMDNGALVWVNELNWFLHRHEPLARAAIAAVTGLAVDRGAPELVDALRAHADAAAIDEVLRRLRAETGVDARRLAAESALYLTWEEARRIAGRGATLGNHTVTHPNLARMGGEDARAEIRQAHLALATEVGAPRALAYPFGDLSADAAEEARALGYGSLFEVTPRSAGFDRFSIARTPVPAGSVARVFAAIEIVEPFKGLVRSLGARLRGSWRRPAPGRLPVLPGA